MFYSRVLFGCILQVLHSRDFGMTVPFLNPLLGSETVEQQDLPTAMQCESLATSDSMPQVGGLMPQVSMFAMQRFEGA
jgi:hypothetical protein